MSFSVRYLDFDQSDPENIGRTRPTKDFDLLLKQFVRDLVEGKKVTSRMNRDDIVKYGRALSELSGITSTQV